VHHHRTSLGEKYLHNILAHGRTSLHQAWYLVRCASQCSLLLWFPQASVQFLVSSRAWPVRASRKQMAAIHWEGRRSKEVLLPELNGSALSR
jgi:hypothetical protein